MLHSSDADDAVGPTWPVDADTAARLSVRWPASYGWPPARKWVQWLRDGLSDHVAVAAAEIPQEHEGVVVIEVVLDGVLHQVAIDYFDGERVLDEVVERYPLIFKFQYATAGYGHEHVVPGGYVPAHQSLSRYLRGVRAVRDHRRPRFDVYGRFGASYASEVRRRAVDLLQRQNRFRYEGSLAILPYPVYLREAALSRVCIDLPGNGDLCHRLVDYLAIGCCVVRPAPVARLHVPLQDGVEIRYVRPDFSDLVEVCDELVTTPERVTALGRSARRYFERFLHPAQLTGYYIDRCLALLAPGR